MNKYYFSFGQAHLHRINGRTFDKDCIVEIEAETSEQAHERMFELFGPKWGGQYDANKIDEVVEKYYPRGIIAV